MKRWTIIAGSVLVLPSFLFVAANVLKFEVGIPFLYDSTEGLIKAIDAPIIILGGLLGAMAINLWPILHVSVKREEEQVTGSVAVRLSAGNLAVVGLAGALLAVILGYLVLENLGHLMRGVG